MNKKSSGSNLKDLESLMAELDQIVVSMEAGQLSIEKAFQQFERGVVLTKQCQKLLKDAEHKVEILLQNQNIRDFHALNDQDDE